MNGKAPLLEESCTVGAGSGLTFWKKQTLIALTFWKREALCKACIYSSKKNNHRTAFEVHLKTSVRTVVLPKQNLIGLFGFYLLQSVAF